MRVINLKVDTKPNIYYFDNNTPLNWPKEPELPEPGELEEIQDMYTSTKRLKGTLVFIRQPHAM